jgi:hypothetical protein
MLVVHEGGMGEAWVGHGGHGAAWASMGGVGVVVVVEFQALASA